ncbi:MAG: beta-galactosidase [Pontiellaceae bacterium]|nr:beta-galactosidase [Pontiellaceae bacterium]MBN2783860.1 beta-galactosidase [Pontiellaceae bacterium]
MNTRLLITAFLMMPALHVAAATDLYRFDVPEEIPAAKSGLLEIGPSNPDGPVWDCTSRYMTLDGKPFMPVMGEFHFSRYPAAEWDEELAKMKAGGIDIVSTYLFWIHHEEEEGVFDFSGQRDIRRFVELCQKNGLYVWLRPGPWCHAEVRNGGFPDWLRGKFGLKEDEPLYRGKRDGIRSNSPQYLELVEKLFGAYGEQCKGLMAKDGGPVIGVQVENEYRDEGPGLGTEHLEKLIEIARKHGFNVPFFSVTGWMNAPIPEKICLPMFDGYPAAPWNGNTKKLPPRPVYRFDLERGASDTGADLYATASKASKRDLSAYPLMTCEIGVGNQVTAHRRPWVGTLDGVVPAFTRLGIGAGSVGYYVYHGGTNPDGEFSTLQESRATGYYNDYPVKSYDFEAAIRESGRIDEKYYYLRKMHSFMHDFGELLAPTVAILPDRAPEKNEDFSMARMSLRTDGRLGFLFVNNHVRGYEQPARENVQVAVGIGGREILVPSEPITIPSSAYFVWPVNLPMDGATLLYATAQPQLVLNNGNGKTYVFAQTITEKAEYVFDAGTVLGKRARYSVEPGLDSAFLVKTRSGDVIRILTLTAEQALQALTVDDGLILQEISAPVKIGTPGVEPVGENEWSIRCCDLPSGALLRIAYTGNVAELYLGDRLIYDNFYNGEVFEVGLDRYAEELKMQSLTLRISPLPESIGVYLDVTRPSENPVLESVELVVD